MGNAENVSKATASRMPAYLRYLKGEAGKGVGYVSSSAIATALILGILVNVLVNIGKKKGENVQASEAPVSEETPETAETAAPAEAPETTKED